MPKVSVIIPTYNRSKYLCEAIDSVLAQTYKDFEIIVIDDGSTDDTRNVLNERYDGRIQYLYQANQGYSVAANKGIEASVGEYIAILGDDDLWLPEKLERQVRQFDDHPEFGFVGSESLVINGQGLATDHYKRGQGNVDTFESLYEMPFIPALTVVIRRRCLDEVGYFDPQLPNAQDYDLWLRLAKRYRFCYMDMPLAKYRLHGSNLSRNIDQRIKDHVMVVNKPEIAGDFSFMKRRIRTAKVYYQFAGYYVAAKQFYKAGICYLKSVLCFPLTGYYYWPRETRNTRFSLPYRILKIYFLAFYYFGLALTDSIMGTKKDALRH